jgi:hypothetical protein
MILMPSTKVVSPPLCLSWSCNKSGRCVMHAICLDMIVLLPWLFVAYNKFRGTVVLHLTTCGYSRINDEDLRDALE